MTSTSGRTNQPPKTASPDTVFQSQRILCQGLRSGAPSGKHGQIKAHQTMSGITWETSKEVKDHNCLQALQAPTSSQIWLRSFIPDIETSCTTINAKTRNPSSRKALSFFRSPAAGCVTLLSVITKMSAAGHTDWYSWSRRMLAASGTSKSVPPRNERARKSFKEHLKKLQYNCNQKSTEITNPLLRGKGSANFHASGKPTKCPVTP